MKIINIEKCWTGRRWFQIHKWFAIGFGPHKFIERIWFNGRYVYINGEKGE